MVKPFGDFLASLRTSAGLSLEDLAVLADSSKSTISRLENAGVSYPLRSTVRKQIISLAEIVCTSPKDSERYLELVGMKRSYLTETEEIQLAFTPVILPGIAEEEHDLIRLQHVYEQRLAGLETHMALVKRVPACLEIKLQHYTNNLNEIKKRLERLERLRIRQIAPNYIIGQNKRLKLFYCYAREDRALRDELDKHLGNLKRQGKITVWYDNDIHPGKVWEKEIIDNLNAVDIILLLITPDFMNSDFCYGIEMKRALERHFKGEARVIPIILRPCDWKDTPFSNLQVLPSNSKAVNSSYWLHRDEALADIAEGIRKVVNELET